MQSADLWQFLTFPTLDCDLGRRGCLWGSIGGSTVTGGALSVEIVHGQSQIFHRFCNTLYRVRAVAFVLLIPKLQPVCHYSDRSLLQVDSVFYDLLQGLRDGGHHLSTQSWLQITNQYVHFHTSRDTCL